MSNNIIDAVTPGSEFTGISTEAARRIRESQ